MTNITNFNEKIFENIKHVDENDVEFWYARELYRVLEYTEWRNFQKVIDKAIEAFKNSDLNPNDWLVDVSKPITTGKGKTEHIQDYKLTRYACYLIVMNGDPRKEAIALGQTYFAVKTRQQELIENYNQLDEDQKRLAIRQEMIEHNKRLAETAKKAGVVEPIDYAIFQNEGYKGLYGGLGQKEIHESKGLKKNQKILDNMGTTELAANLFRATQTEESIRKENIKGKAQANQTHHQVGRKIRQTIKDLGGTLPENLPVEEDIKKIEKKLMKK